MKNPNEFKKESSRCSVFLAFPKANENFSIEVILVSVLLFQMTHCLLVTAFGFVLQRSSQCCV